MDDQRIALSMTGLILLLSDAWQDGFGWAGFDAGLKVAVCLRTVLLVLTLVALIRPTPLLVLVVLAFRLLLLGWVCHPLTHAKGQSE